MKQADLTVQQLIAWKGMIQDAVSAGVINIGGKQYTVKSETIYIAGWLNQTKNGEILVQANQPEVGFRSFPNAKLPAGVFHLVESARVLFDTSKAGQTDADLIACTWEDPAPAQFKNGEVTITQGAELLKTSGTDLTNFEASYGNDADFRNMVPFVFRPQTNTSINFELAGAAPANVAYKFEYRCVTFTEAGKS